MICDCPERWDLPGRTVVHRLLKWKGIITEERDDFRWLMVRFITDVGQLVSIEVSRFEVEPEFGFPDDGEGDEIEPEDNVIPVDFTKGVKLTKDTKTRGAA